ncbi:MAG: murein biosynthesis integral membrane protein MurJ, partial [Pseudomonadota bacterium]
MSTKPANSSLARSGSVVGAMTLISRVLGFIRDQVFAIALGAGPMTDAFLVAFKIPNFLRRLFAEGAFAQSFVPVFTEYKETRSREALVALAARVSGTFGTILIIVSVLGSLFAPAIVALFAPGFEEGGQREQLTTQMLRITFPYLFFISMVAYAAGVLNSFNRFAIPALTPVFLNICLITAALWGTKFFAVPVVALAWGVFIAGAVQLAFQLPSMYRLGLLVMPQWGWRDSGVRKILNLMLPGCFGFLFEEKAQRPFLAKKA